MKKRERMLPDNLIALAAEIAAEQGAKAVTIREIAARAGLTPPAVHYHFGSKHAIYSAAAEAVSDRIAVWLSKNDLSNGLFTREMPEAAQITGVFSAALSSLGLDLIARIELSRPLYLRPSEYLYAAARIDREDRLWQSAVLGPDAHASVKALWPIVLRGSIPRLMLEDPGIRRETLLSAIIQRTSARLQGLPNIDRLEPPPNTFEAQPTDWPSGKVAVVNAAIRTIARYGVEGVTHRRIAQEGNISISATTYYFAKKADIVLATFLYAQTIATRSAISTKSFPQNFVSSIVAEDGNVPDFIAVLTELNLASIRNPVFKKLNAVNRYYRGINAARWLTSIGFGDIDHLDGIIWASIMTGITESVLTLDNKDRKSHSLKNIEMAFNTLFCNHVNFSERRF